MRVPLFYFDESPGLSFMIMRKVILRGVFRARLQRFIINVSGLVSSFVTCFIDRFYQACVFIPCGDGSTLPGLVDNV